MKTSRPSNFHLWIALVLQGVDPDEAAKRVREDQPNRGGGRESKR